LFIDFTNELYNSILIQSTRGKLEPSTYRQPIAHFVLKIHRKYIGQLEMKK